MKAPEFLQAALGHMQDRATTYDKPDGERSMGRTVEAFNAITSHTLTEEQGWLFMGLLKMVRSQSGDFKADNFEDEAAYAALRGECAASANRKPSPAFAEKIKAAETAADDGWIMWAGGECPVGIMKRVTVRLHNLRTITESAGRFTWINNDTCNDIIAYRIHKERV
jgi:hypothetical protein